MENLHLLGDSVAVVVVDSVVGPWLFDSSTLYWDILISKRNGVTLIVPTGARSKCE